MKIGICSALADKVNPELSYIGVDYGVEVLINQGIHPIYTIGDFDSLINKEKLSNLNLKQLPTRKDVTDTHAAIEYAIEQGYDEIDIYGVTGGRLDHFFAAMCLLEKYENVNIRIIDDQNEISILRSGYHKIESASYKYFSLFALNYSYIDIEHAHYPLNNYYLMRSDPLCVSNETIDGYAWIRTSNNIILIKSKDKINNC